MWCRNRLRDIWEATYTQRHSIGSTISSKRSLYACFYVSTFASKEYRGIRFFFLPQARLSVHNTQTVSRHHPEKMNLTSQRICCLSLGSMSSPLLPLYIWITQHLGIVLIFNWQLLRHPFDINWTIISCLPCCISPKAFYPISLIPILLSPSTTSSGLPLLGKGIYCSPGSPLDLAGTPNDHSLALDSSLFHIYRHIMHYLFT
jgi:hypothetical protein